MGLLILATYDQPRVCTPPIDGTNIHLVVYKCVAQVTTYKIKGICMNFTISGVKTKAPWLVLVVSLTIALSGCGGGGGSTAAVSAAPTSVTPPTAVTLEGVAATGAPFTGALITVYDKTGTAVGTVTTDATTGGYTITLPASAQAPFVLEAVRDDQTLVSVIAGTGSSVVNITSITTLIASRMSQTGDPVNLKTAFTTDPTTITSAKLASRVAEILAVLKPLLDALGVTTDPITGKFVADGTGFDRLLDSVNISIRPSGAFANIEITVKTIPTSDSASPIKVSFQSNADTLLPVTTGVISPSTLLASGLPVQLADFITRINACYALPVASRVDSTAASAGPANVIASACRSLFLNDDPASYKNNGFVVGQNRNTKTFFSLYLSGADNLVFDRANFEFVRANGDVVFSYRNTDSLGGVLNDLFVVRKVGNVFKLVGNQFDYNARIRPIVQDRDFINQPASSYLSAGYNLFIPNVLDNANNPIFTQVKVTALGNGASFILKPTAGGSFLGLVNSNGSVSGSSIVRLAATFKNTATVGTPSTYDTGLYFATPALSDAQISAIAEQTVWSFEFSFASGAAPVTQNYKTISRAPTLAEAAQTVFATVVDKQELASNTSANFGRLFGAAGQADPNVINLAFSNNRDWWSVPAGAVAPTFVTAFGRSSTGVGFDDSLNVSPSTRKAVINCSKQSTSDNHCDATFTSQYANGSKVTGIQLFSVNARFVENVKFNALYKLIP